jgi:hypothetical protein
MSHGSLTERAAGLKYSLHEQEVAGSNAVSRKTVSRRRKRIVASPTKSHMAGTRMAETLSLLTPPQYCHYASGACDQVIGEPLASKTVFFMYASIPEQIAVAVETAIEKLTQSQPNWSWKTWKQLPVAGHTIFCEVCKAIRHATAVVADVTTLNFNLLFEIGYTIGLGVPVIPIRDTNLQTDRRTFEELGLLDTLGYVDFRNSNELQEKLIERLPATPLAPVPLHEYRETPIYVLKGPVETEGAIQMMSALKETRISVRMTQSRRRVSLSTRLDGRYRDRGRLLPISSTHQGRKLHSIMLRVRLFAALLWLNKKPLR